MEPAHNPRSVQFIDNYFPVIDGVTETVHEYARHMDALVICPAMEAHYQERHSFPYRVQTSATLRIPFSRYASALPWANRKLEAAIRREEPEIFHLHSPSLLGRYAVSQGRKMKIPVVATFHSKYYDAVLEFTKSRLIARKVTDNIIRLLERCDEVWACSEEAGETLHSYGYNKEYFVMPNGTDVSRPANERELRENAAAYLHLPQGKHVLLFVGQQIWYKNQRLILDTFRLLCDRRGDCFLVMVGSGKDEKDIARYAASLNLTEEQIRFTGLISDRDLLRGIYLNAELLFFPSVFDNSPLVVREAAVLGIPALVTEGSNAAGAIRKNVNGFTAAADPQAMCGEIEGIIQSGRAGEVGQMARETIPLSWERLIPMVQERYRIVAERCRRQA